LFDDAPTREQGWVVLSFEHSGLGSARTAGTIRRIRPPPSAAAGPLPLGADTRAILADSWVDDGDAIDQLRADGIVAFR
jgi:hypothetical protein